MAHMNPQTIPPFPQTKGLNTVTNPAIMDPAFLTRADNIDFAFDGTREKRGGVKKYNTTRIIVVGE